MNHLQFACVAMSELVIELLLLLEYNNSNWSIDRSITPWCVRWDCCQKRSDYLFHIAHQISDSPALPSPERSITQASKVFLSFFPPVLWGKVLGLSVLWRSSTKGMSQIWLQVVQWGNLEKNKRKVKFFLQKKGENPVMLWPPSWRYYCLNMSIFFSLKLWRLLQFF